MDGLFNCKKLFGQLRLVKKLKEIKNEEGEDDYR